jgi:flotillin
VQAALVGHTRALAARTPIEDVFSERAKFAADVQDSIAQFLAEYGLRVLNVTMRELLDVPGCEYFGPLSEKVTATARNKATAEVAADGAFGPAATSASRRRFLARSSDACRGRPCDIRWGG